MNEIKKLAKATGISENTISEMNIHAQLIERAVWIGEHEGGGVVFVPPCESRM